jgi:zinc protease
MFGLPKRGTAASLAALLALLSVPADLPAQPAPADVTRATLPNGLRVVIVRDPLAPVATEIMNYLVGGEDTPAGFPGMAHAEEHMVAGRSTKELDEDQVATLTSLLGGDFDADTQTAVTQYYLSTPAPYLEAALRIEAARMSDALDLQSEWAEERGAIEQEVSRDLSNAFYRYYETALARLFAGTAYAHDALGTRASFNATTGAQLKEFWRTWYAPNNAILVITGDVDPQATLASVREIFGAIPRHAVPAHPLVELRPPSSTAIVRDESDFPVPLAIQAYRMPGFASPDFAAADVAMDVLASERGDLSALQYEGKALATGSDYEPSPQAGLAYVYIATAPHGDAAAALDLVTNVIENYRKNGVSADLVEAMKKREIAQLLYNRNSVEGLAQAWSQAVAVQRLGSPDDVVELYEKVTPADVLRVMRKYLVRDRAVVGILTPKPGAAEGGGGAIGVHDTFTPKNVKPAALPAWAADLATLPPVPASNVQPADMTLPNGIRLIVQTERVSPTVTLTGTIQHQTDLQTPPGQEGVEDVLDALFPYGTQTYDRLAFQKQLDDIAANLAAGASFSLSVPASDFDRGVALLADVELHPALPADAFLIAQQQLAQTLAGQLQTPDYLAERALGKALVPAGDPTLRETTPQSVDALTPADVQKYFATIFRPDLTTIVVAGDITPDDAKATVTKYFGGWSASGPKPQIELPPVPNNLAASGVIAAPGRTQASVTLAEQTGLKRSDPDYYPLQVGNTILGGGFYSTRLYRDLRQHAGLVYNVSVGASATRTRGSYSVDYGCDPENAGRARVIIERDLRDMATSAPSDDEMNRAKVQLLRDLDLSEGSVDGIASRLLADAVADLPLDQPQRGGAIVRGLSGEQVRAAFAKWVDPARFVQITVGPPAK